MTHEELFNYCLSILESPDSVAPSPLSGVRFPNAIPNSIFQLTQPSAEPFLLAQICINCTRYDVIKVMKFGIFYKGGFKGRPFSKHDIDYMIYPFKDLVHFILLATSHVISEKEKPDEYLRYYNSAFDRAINTIGELEYIASCYRSKRNSDKLVKIMNNLEDIKLDLLKKPDIPMPHRLKEMGDSIDQTDN